MSKQQLRAHSRAAHRSLLISLSDMECVLQYGIHDPAQAKGGLNYTRNNFFHCKRDDNSVTVVSKEPHDIHQSSEMILGTKATSTLDGL